MTDAAKVVSIALAEVGYREKATNASLDDPAANAGSGNWTKYARDLAAAGYYNGSKNGFAWCDVFVDWCFYKAFGPDAQRIQCQTGPLGAACPYSAGYYRAQGRYDGSPQVGDQIFFRQNGALVHTGIVAEVTAAQIVTVEGNSSDRVAKRTYARTDGSIDGYGHPRYGGEPSPAAVTVALSALTSGSTGPQVKTVQRILYSYGVKGADGKAIAVDGEFGPNTAHAVRLLQGKLGLAADGAVGADTWRSMLTELS